MGSGDNSTPLSYFRIFLLKGGNYGRGERCVCRDEVSTLTTLIYYYYKLDS